MLIILDPCCPTKTPISMRTVYTMSCHIVIWCVQASNPEKDLFLLWKPNQDPKCKTGTQAVKRLPVIQPWQKQSDKFQAVWTVFPAFDFTFSLYLVRPYIFGTDSAILFGICSNFLPGEWFWLTFLLRFYLAYILTNMVTSTVKSNKCVFFCLYSFMRAVSRQKRNKKIL